MNTVKQFVIIVLLAFSHMSIAYGLQSGSDLLRYCKNNIKLADGLTPSMSENDKNEAIICVGYITGIADFNAVLVELKKGYFCRPLKANNGTLVRVVVKYLEDNPGKLHYAPGGLAINALMKAYPCK